jgi:hypothetical protein
VVRYIQECGLAKEFVLLIDVQDTLIAVCISLYLFTVLPFYRYLYISTSTVPSAGCEHPNPENLAEFFARSKSPKDYGPGLKSATRHTWTAYPAGIITDSAVASLAPSQYSDGHWPEASGLIRSPSSEGAIGITADAVLALQAYTIRARQIEFRERTARAAEWLLKIQKIVDIVVPRTVFGRVCLLGDAAFVVRPHTAGATAKAAKDATSLTDALRENRGDIKEALLSFQSAQLRYGHELHQYGVALGNRWATAR